MSYGYGDRDPDVENLAPGIQRVTEAYGSRYYVWTKPDGSEFRAQAFSTILNGGWTKDWLNPWTVKTIAQVIIEKAQEDPDYLIKRLTDDPVDAEKWVKGFPYSRKPSQRAIGSAVHAATEALDAGKPIPQIYADGVTLEHVKPYAEQYARFGEDWKPTIIANEAPVISEKWNYAGTLDRIMDLETPAAQEFARLRLLVDIKTGAGVYAEAALQLNAYAHAEWLGMPDGVVPMLDVDGVATLWLRPDDYQLQLWPLSREIFEGFLYVREVYRLKRDVLQGLRAHPIDPGQLIISDYLREAE